jgi:hypothetical protein
VSTARAPTRTTFVLPTGTNPGTSADIEPQQSPTAMESPVPSRKPLVVVSGVWKSAWASNHTIPNPCVPAPDTVPTQALQLPEITRGCSPVFSAALTSSEIRRLELEGGLDLQRRGIS